MDPNQIAAVDVVRWLRHKAAEMESIAVQLERTFNSNYRKYPELTVDSFTTWLRTFQYGTKIKRRRYCRVAYAGIHFGVDRRGIMEFLKTHADKFGKAAGILFVKTPQP
jgi:hypothetical protein